MKSKATLVCALALLVLAACATPPRFDYPKSPSFALEDTQTTTLGRSVMQRTHGRAPDESGFYVLTDGVDALSARLILAGRAERSIDAQYFLIQNDLVGNLFVDSLLDAADRGVRVRLLIDDIVTVGDDAAMAAVDSHPNIEVRVFNPFSHRSSARNIEYLTDLSRVDHRMHNKSFNVDNQVAIVGGRNIGNEYFDANVQFEFADVDVIAFGPVVKEVSGVFDTFWNSKFAVPVPALVESTSDPNALRGLRKHHNQNIARPENVVYGTSLQNATTQNILDPKFPLWWGVGKVVFDDPEQVEKASAEIQTVRAEIAPELMAAKSELLVVSPYFVPLKDGLKRFQEIRKNGVRVVALTNSLASTDMIPAHAGYANARRQLLEMGVELYEVKPAVSFDEEGKSGLDFTHTAIHLKVFTIDRRFIFVGSFNWDPRSSYLNTEMGVLIEAPELAQWAAGKFTERLPKHAFRVQLTPEGDLEWTSRSGGQETVYSNEPETGFWRRFMSDFMGILPIEGET